MKTCNAVKKMGLGLELTGLFAWQAGATIQYNGVYSTSGGTPVTSPNNTLLGNLFGTGATPVTITALGAYDPSSGFAGPVTVAIYQLSGYTWTRLGQVATFTSSGSYTVQNNYAYQNVDAGLVLAAGGNYAVIASGYGPSAFEVNNTTFNNLGVGLNTLGFGLAMGGSSLPTTFAFNPVNINLNTYAAGTFAAVPEAADFALVAVVLLGLVYVGRSYSQKLKIA